eukprot:CAMPEP_0177603770 /NCGR_PEP_ID=MMETSP0419_2-20121207/15716_1 /TAXON_ID=582737 /ORGANISM="Tetraselmis sp., Strain GSL018" /LENGTH=256 /DNA_ID=CAMNT_0019097617 /DNA_START=12 /DNA_END=782 /DNA_ORIENTATION=-
MVPTKPIKAVLFDFDDTLCITSGFDKIAWDACKDLAQERLDKVDGQALINDFRELFRAKPWDIEHKVEVTKWRANLWLEALGRQSIADEPLSEALQACYDRVRYGSLAFLDGVEETVRELQKRGIATCIITNGHHRVQRDKLQAVNAYRLFEHIIVGGEEVLGGRKEKPDPAIFAKALRYLGCQAGEAIHVGDSLSSDVQGGINAGLAATVWVNPSGSPPPPGKPQPTYTIASVNELLSLLNKIEQQVNEEQADQI